MRVDAWREALPRGCLGAHPHSTPLSALGHSLQQFLEKLLGNNMALEVKQVQRMNQSDNLSWDLEQLSDGRQLPLCLGARLVVASPSSRS